MFSVFELVLLVSVCWACVSLFMVQIDCEFLSMFVCEWESLSMSPSVYVLGCLCRSICPVLNVAVLLCGLHILFCGSFSACLTVCLALLQSLCLSLTFCLYVCDCVCVYLCMSVCVAVLSVSLSLWKYFCRWMYVPMCVSFPI